MRLKKRSLHLIAITLAFLISFTSLEKTIGNTHQINYTNSVEVHIHEHSHFTTSHSHSHLHTNILLVDFFIEENQANLEKKLASTNNFILTNHKATELTNKPFKPPRLPNS